MATPTTTPTAPVPSIAITPPPAPSAPNISQYVSAAASMLNPGFSDVVSAEQAAGQTQAQNDAMLAQQQEEQITTVQQQYADLSKSLGVEQEQETTQAQQAGEAETGAAQVALAKSGIDQSAQGAFGAPVTAARQDVQNTIAQIATKYGTQQQTIFDSLNASVQQLQQKAADYTAQGNTELANMTVQIAQMKLQQNQQIESLAQQMQTSETTYEQNAWKDYMDEVRATNDSATLSHLAAEDTHLAAEDAQIAANQTNGYSFKSSGGSLSFTDKSKSPVTLASYLTGVNGSVSPSDVVGFLQQNGSAQDKQKALSITNTVNQFVGKIYNQDLPIGSIPDLSTLSTDQMNQLQATLEKTYPEIFGQF